MYQLLKLIHIVAAIIFLALTGGASDTFVRLDPLPIEVRSVGALPMVATVTPLVAIVLMVIKRPA